MYYDLDFGFFDFTIPDVNGAHSVVIRDISGQKIAERIISQNAPTVNVATPNGGEHFAVGQNISIEWDASDPDTDPSQPLYYSVAISYDNGQSWFPITLDHTEKTLDFTIPPVDDTNLAMVRIMATDGINTSIDVSDSTFSISNVPPAVTIYPSKDSYLRKLLPNTNEGINKALFVTFLGSNRALAAFDQAQIANAVAGKTLESATLKLYITNNVNDWGSSGRDIEARPLLTSWPEGNGYNEKIVIPKPGTGHGVTWNCADDYNINNNKQDCPTKWNGGKFGAVASKVKITNGKTGWISFDVTNDVKNGLSNNGWIIKKSDESKLGAILLASRENLSNGPQLVLTFGP